MGVELNLPMHFDGAKFAATHPTVTFSAARGKLRIDDESITQADVDAAEATQQERDDRDEESSIQKRQDRWEYLVTKKLNGGTWSEQEQTFMTKAEQAKRRQILRNKD